MKASLFDNYDDEDEDEIQEASMEAEHKNLGEQEFADDESLEMEPEEKGEHQGLEDGEEDAIEAQEVAANKGEGDDREAGLKEDSDSDELKKMAEGDPVEAEEEHDQNSVEERFPNKEDFLRRKILLMKLKARMNK